MPNTIAPMRMRRLSLHVNLGAARPLVHTTEVVISLRACTTKLLFASWGPWNSEVRRMDGGQPTCYLLARMSTSWETVKDGVREEISVSEAEVSLSSGSGALAAGTGISHAAFLGGRFQDQVAWTFGCAVLQEVIAAVRSFHPDDWQPGSLDEEARRQVLRAAIREGHVEMVRALVDQGLDPNPQGPYDLWPLWETCHYAPSPNRVEVVKTLLEGGADPNLTVQNADNVLLGVIDSFTEPSADLAPIAAALLDHGLNLEARDSARRTALMSASGRGLPELVAVLLDRGADVHASTGEPLHETPLQAAMHGDSRVREGRHKEVIELLVRHGGLRPEDTPAVARHAAKHGYAALLKELTDEVAEVDRADRYTQRTALMEAAAAGETEVVRSLVGRGAALDRRDHAGRQSLALAAGEGHAETVRLLLDSGADIHARDRDGNTALLCAVKGGKYQRPDIRTIETLLARGASTADADELGVTAVMMAADLGRVDVVRCLLSHGAPIDATDKEGRTALDRRFSGLLVADGSKGSIREPKESREVAKALLASGAEPNHGDPTGCTPLALATIVGRVDLVELLLEHGADPNNADGLGVTPLMQAALYGREDATEWLLLQGADVKALTRDGQAARDLTHDPGIVRLLEGVGARRGGGRGAICGFSECPICRQLSDRESADENRGEHLPPARRRLTISGDRSDRIQPYRCPYCGTRYEEEDTSDNSEFYPVLQLRRTGKSTQ